MRWDALFDRDILFVSGKGGTGKSTVAAALATSAAAAGRGVLLVEVEGRSEMTRTLGLDDPGFREVQAANGLSVLSILPQAAALEYLHLYFGLDRVSRAVLNAGVLDQIISAAPGFRDLLACGKLYEITSVRRTNPRDRGRTLYDLVVVDAPPTGQIAAFLGAPGAYGKLIRVGRMRRHAVQIRRHLRSRAQVVIVTLLEEMSVAETLEALPAVTATGIPVGAIVANRRFPEVLPRGSSRAFDALTGEEAARLASQAGLPIDAAVAARVLAAATAGEGRHRLQSSFLGPLRRAGVPVLQLPEIAGADPPQVVPRLAEIMSGGDPGPPPTPRSATRFETASRRGGRMAPTRLGPHLEGPRIVLLCGSGGVGKTTISAAVALHMAERRKRAVLLTVDPARRLATALRLPTVAGARTTIRVGRTTRLEAIQLDTQSTFDELVRRHAGTPERRDRILENRFYRSIADTLAGTSEYMAMEKLYELASEEDHDAIVIDTPPTRSALSFLDAPNRLTDFLGGRLLRWMLWPSARAGRFTLNVAKVGAAAFARTVGKLVGAEALADTVEFLSAFEGMYGGFKERAARVLDLLASKECAFVVVTAPAAASLMEAGYFVDRLRERDMHPAAAIVNRWHDEPPLDLPAGRAPALTALGDGDGKQRALAAAIRDWVRWEPRRAAEAEAVDGFAATHRDLPVVAVPELPGDIHDVRGLRRVAAELFGE